MAAVAVRLHRLLVPLTHASAAGLAFVGLVFALVGVPALVVPDEAPRIVLAADPHPLSLLLVVFAVSEAWAVHRGRFRPAWVGAAGLVLFSAAFYPGNGHLVAPVVAFNVLSLAALHGLDEYLVRF